MATRTHKRQRVFDNRRGTVKDLEWFFACGSAKSISDLRLRRNGNLLDQLSPPDRALFLSKCTRKTYSKHQVIFAAGQVHSATYVIDTGLVQTYYQSVSGREITSGYRTPGELVGGPHFFDDTGIHVWSSRAVQDSELLAISGSDLRLLSTQITGIGDAVFDTITSKLIWDSLLLQALGTRTIKDRLSHVLVRLAVFHGIGDTGHILIRHFTQEDLANMVGATRQWVNIQMKQFKGLNLVDMRNKSIVILDLKGLMENA